MEVRSQQGLLLIIGFMGIFAFLSSFFVTNDKMFYLVYFGVSLLIIDGGLGKFFNSKNQNVNEKFFFYFSGSFVLIVSFYLFVFSLQFLGWLDFFFVILVAIWIVSGLLPFFPFTEQRKLEKELLQRNNQHHSSPFFRGSNNSNYQNFDSYTNEN